MKIKLLFAALLAVSVLGLRAQDLVSPKSAELTNFIAPSGSFTIEAEAVSAGTEIKIPYDAYTYMTYTPETAGTVRFVVENGMALVYEKAEDGRFVFKKKADVTATEYPEVTDENVNEINLLEDGDFAEMGEKRNDYNGNPAWALGAAWLVPDKVATNTAIRVTTHTNAHDGFVYLWRADPDPADGWFSQEVTNKIKPNGRYQVRMKIVSYSNNTGPVSVCLGSAAGDYSYSYQSFTTGVNTYVKELTTPAKLGESSYFSVVNRGIVNGTNSTVYMMIQIDWISMVEATLVNQQIVGASSAQYVEEAVYPQYAEDTDMTYLIANAAVTSEAGWTGGRKNSNEQYTGAPDNTYLDAWDATFNMVQDIMLPAGRYVLRCATRGSDNLGTANIYVSKDGKNLNSTDVHKDGNSGGDLGNGWGWTEVPFELTVPSTVRIGFYSECGNGKWAGADDFHLTLLGTNTSARMELEASIATASKFDGTNVGDKPFQHTDSSWEKLQTALGEAQKVMDDASSTTENIKAATETLNAAIAAYNMLNVPDPAQAYHLVFNCEGHSASGNALTLFPTSKQPQGNYGLKYLAPANVNLAQAFYFTHTTGNKYKLHAIDAEDEIRYLTTQAEGYGTAWYDGIRTITDETKAMEIEIRPNGEGLYLLWNNGNNGPISHNGLTNDDMFSNPANLASFQFVETTKPSIAINTAAGWGTVMLPFAVAGLPEDVTAYSCAGVEENGTTLVLTVAEELEANKPYIIEGVWNATLTGDAKGAALTYTDGLLTGVYAETTAPKGSYVLQNQNDVLGFYLVDSDIEVPANRAYLTVNGSGVKGFFFGSDDATAVKGIEAAGEEAGAIYNLAGQRVEKAVKGIYIINGKKVLVK